MTIKTPTLPLVLVLALLLGGCASGPKEGVGTLGGAATGALIGAQFGHGPGQLVAIGVGTLIGAVIGADIGRSLDQADQMRVHQAHGQAYAAPLGETITWNNPNSGNHGTITTTRDGYTAQGDYCREFQETIIIGGRPEKAAGTACRQPDGTWKIVSN